MTMANAFDRGIMEKNTKLILNNMSMISDIILEHDVKQLIRDNTSILKMALERKYSTRILLAARKLSSYICWDNQTIYELTMEVINRNGIYLGPRGQKWLWKNIDDFRKFLYS